MLILPDYGKAMKGTGLNRGSHSFYGVLIFSIDVLPEGRGFTSSLEVLFLGKPHCLSIDFGREVLEVILPALPDMVRGIVERFARVKSPLARLVNLPSPIEVNVVGSFGRLQISPHETFIPLTVTEMNLVS